MLWNYFVSELRHSASQNLSKKDGAVKTATFFSERFCEADWPKFRNKESARRPPWLTDSIDGRSLCTLIFSVVVALSSATLLPLEQRSWTYFSERDGDLVSIGG